MKYIITRTSSFGEQAHPLAVKVISYKYKDVRTFANKEEWLGRFPRDAQNALEWGVTSFGNPYRIIERENYFYVIDIDNLHEFIKEVGDVVIKPPSDKYGHEIEREGMFKIEIYDDYRE